MRLPSSDSNRTKSRRKAGSGFSAMSVDFAVWASCASSALGPKQNAIPRMISQTMFLLVMVLSLVFFIPVDLNSSWAMARPSHVHPASGDLPALVLQEPPFVGTPPRSAPASVPARSTARETGTCLTSALRLGRNVVWNSVRAACVEPHWRGDHFVGDVAALARNKRSPASASLWSPQSLLDSCHHCFPQPTPQ